MKRKRIIRGLCMAVFLSLFLSGCAGQEKNTETASPLPTPTEAAVSDVPDDDTPTPTQEAQASPTALPTPTDETAVKPDILEWYGGIDGVGYGELEEYVLSELFEDEEMLSFQLLLSFYETEIEDVYVGILKGWLGEYKPTPTPTLPKYDVYTFAEDAVYIMSSQNFPYELSQELFGVEEIGAVYFRTTKETWQREQKRAHLWACGVKDKVIYYVYPFIGP